MGDVRSEKAELSVLTINLHCYQEEDPLAKLAVVARAIRELNPDVVALQECAQDKDSPVVLSAHHGVTIREDNMAWILTGLLAEQGLRYDFFWDWSHYGFDRWEEGCAVLTRHPLGKNESRYVTRTAGPSLWKSRKPVAAVVEVEKFGPVAVFSAHLGWWDDSEEPFSTMFRRLLAWQKRFLSPGVLLITLGDFNIEAGSEGYRFLTKTSGWIDGYLEVHPDGMNDHTIGGPVDGWETSSSGQRIDYAFYRRNELVPIRLDRIFTEADYGRVSDHVGLYGVFHRHSLSW